MTFDEFTIKHNAMVASYEDLDTNTITVRFISKEDKSIEFIKVIPADYAYPSNKSKVDGMTHELCIQAEESFNRQRGYKLRCEKEKKHLITPLGYESEDDMVSHPPHYQAENGMEVIDVIEAFTSNLNGIEATDTGNVIKYILRWKQKNGIQDLEKIMWYTQHLINHLKKEQN